MPETKSKTKEKETNSSKKTTIKDTLKKEKESPDKANFQLKKPPFLFDKTQTELARLSSLLGCPVLSYFKPPSGVIWSQDLYAISECLKTIGHQEKLALYIRSSGGQGMVSLRIINLLRSFADKLILLAPLECASAATMLALGCDEIFMGPLSSLSPVDSSLTHSLSPVDSLNGKVPISLDELWRVLRLWQEADKQNFDHGSLKTMQNSNLGVNTGGKIGVKNDLEDKSVAREKIDSNSIQNTSTLENEVGGKKGWENPYKYLYEYVHPLVFGAVDRHSSLSLQICKEIMSYHLTDEALIDQINHKLNYDYPSHGYPITAREAKKLGLNIQPISDEMQTILNKLQLLYSEMTEEKITDYDNLNYHDNSVYSITETDNLQITYNQNYDKFYRESEKRYITINDQSGWFKTIKPLGTKANKSGKPKPKTEQIFF